MDAGVKRELDTGDYAAVDPATGEMSASTPTPAAWSRFATLGPRPELSARGPSRLGHLLPSPIEATHHSPLPNPEGLERPPNS